MTTTTTTPTISTRQSAMNARVADVIAHQLASLPAEEQERVLAVLETDPPEVVMLSDGRAEVRIEGRTWAWMTTDHLLEGQWNPAPVPLIVLDLARHIASRLDPTEFSRFAEAIAADPGSVDFEIEDGMCQVFVVTGEGREWLCEIAVVDLLPPPRR